ncbi:MAG: LacI family DNA-binding transcriptional regulator [Lachnospiraceae bacterium]|nr:LacI family DNA-binding transcriptional regulator [Lachnospiraceae bacterium]
MVSMKDISVRCGVSVATVSKALNDHSDISEATKRMVRNCAQEMGYFPNSSARALKTNRTFNLGVLFVDRARNGLTQDYFAKILDSFKVAAEEKGFDLTFINCNKTKQRMTYLEHSRYRGVDGVVIACVDFDQDEVLELVKSDIPVVTIDHSFDHKPSVISDNVKGMRDLVEYVASRGHRRIAYVNGGDRETSSVTRNRMSSFYRTMTELGIPVRDEYIMDADYRNPTLTHDCVKQLLELPEPPTCILMPDDLAAIGGINAIHEKGLEIPGDVSIAAYDGIDIAKCLEPKICTIEQDAAEIGLRAAEKLIGMIEHPKTAIPDRTIVGGQLLPGNSVAEIADQGTAL